MSKRKPSLRALQRELAAMREKFISSENVRGTALSRAQEAESRLSKLKELYAEAQETIAHQHGYITRTREDDTARDRLVEVEEHNNVDNAIGKRLVPIRTLSLGQPARTSGASGALSYMHRDREREKHWSNW